MRNEALFEHRSTPASQPELKATVRSEQIKALYHPPAIMLVNPINASILAAVLWPAYPAWILLLWVGLICVVVSARFLDRARYLRQPHERRHEVAWARRFTVGAAATGFLWGLCASVVFVSPDPVAHVVVTFVLSGMTVGAVFQQSAYLPAFFSFALPATVPQVVCYLAKGDRVSIAMSLMLAVYVVVVALMGRFINRRIVDAVQLNSTRPPSIANCRPRWPRVKPFSTKSSRSAGVRRSVSVSWIPTIASCGSMSTWRRSTDSPSARISAALCATSSPELADGIMELYRQIYERGEPVLNAEIDGAAPTAPSVQRYWLANYFPFRSEWGK